MNQTTQTSPQAPAAVETRPPSLTRNDPFFAIGLTILGFVLLTYGTAFVLGQTRTSEKNNYVNRISDIDNQIKTDPKLQATLTEYTGLNIVAKKIVAMLNARILFMNSWNDIKASVPKDMQFVSISDGSDGTYFITGNAKTVSSVAQFAQALQNVPSKEFTDVAPTSLDKTDGKTIVFSIRFKVSRTAKGGI